MPRNQEQTLMNQMCNDERDCTWRVSCGDVGPCGCDAVGGADGCIVLAQRAKGACHVAVGRP
jgi:hypothetical protein